MGWALLKNGRAEKLETSYHKSEPAEADGAHDDACGGDEPEHKSDGLESDGVEDGGHVEHCGPLFFDGLFLTKLVSHSCSINATCVQSLHIFFTFWAGTKS